MRCLLVFAATLAGLGDAVAQSPIAASTSVETGWTSNAQDSFGGVADVYVRHDSEASVSGAWGPMTLRAGLTLEQTSFIQVTQENDLSIGGGVELGYALREGIGLRTGYEVTRSWTGEAVDLGALRIGVLSPAWEHEALAEVMLAGEGRQVTLGVDALVRFPGESMFDGLEIDPLRLESEVSLVTVRADGQLALSPQVAALARARGFFTSVPVADQEEFGREPADGAQVAGGILVEQGAITFEGRAGFDVVWPENAPRLWQFVPYTDVSAMLAASERLSVTARALREVELVAPIDGVASAVTEAELGARLSVAEAVALSGSVGVRREVGLYDPNASQTKRQVSAGVSFAPSANTELGLLAKAAWVEEPTGAYDSTSLAATFKGSL